MNILLLEDNIALNKAIKRILELSDHIVSTFYDGAEVLKSISNLYDLYILDINVPNINGLELLDLIYNKNNNSKVIIITSNTDLNSLEKAYKLGCIDYIKKPFHLAELRIKTNRLDNSKNDILSFFNLKNDESLSKQEKKLLLLFLEHKGKIVTYNMIDENVYENKTMTMDGLRAMIRRVRAKLNDDIIINVIDEGYRVNS